MAILIDGKKLRNKVNEQTKLRVDKLIAKGIKPGIALILVGDDPASQIYTRNKHKLAEKIGLKSDLYRFPSDVNQETVLDTIKNLNEDDEIDAIIVQEPLPDHLDGIAITNAIRPDKDVDGLHPTNLGKLYANQPSHYPVACTPRGIMRMFDEYDVELEGANVVVIGRSILVGRPMLALLNNANATVTLAGSRTKNLSELTKKADILIVATGKAKMIGADDVKKGAVVIDVGINRMENGKLTGDVDFDAVEPIAGMITPVPGGVGPMTIASLIAQTVDLAEWRRNG
ncbi:MAG: bifunctional methylenetetrahydrofolate dehydrogenase/methenyltetrahydrofolate cyclohydrolase FolD [Limosilactobacillus sp.]|uniref:bifunctional methylenetetrahydrofolate dehydrogenase/methenyltetrahydrofolate cyclohydrolase FolD n=1 Tax=Limosilactobacillus sp. TaxID=2773925 RepID=UPI00270B5A80|nr:bifunctional methylenetetrahydrofolate dehydrogenase/methenyltetrahydrofolate cyclohydrolase FolD [Limosilactobacillus sp.]